jgi:molybdenum cofactor cytidylyltransferase
LSRSLFPAVSRLTGDEGARRLLAEATPGRLIEVAAQGVEATLDVDTPEALIAARKALQS